MIYPEFNSAYLKEANYSYEEPHALDDLWNRLDAFGNEIAFPQKLNENFHLKKEVFFHIVKILMLDGRLRLAKNGSFLLGSIDEQLDKLKNAFPESEESQKEIGGVTTWFFMDECPGGAVWIYKLQDGREHLEWT